MKKPLVVIIHHNGGSDVRYVGDVDVVSVGPKNHTRDRVYQYTAWPSEKAVRHFAGPKKYWSNFDWFAPNDPDAQARSRAALTKTSKLTLFPNFVPDFSVGPKPKQKPVATTAVRKKAKSSPF